MKNIKADKAMIAVCGLYCGACRKYLMDKCPGCRLTMQMKPTGKVFNHSGEEVEPAYWLGKYSDMPHILSFLNESYQTIFNVLETDNEVEMAKAFCFSVFTSSRSFGSGVVPSFFAWLMRDFAWLISRRFAFTLRITML